MHKKNIERLTVPANGVIRVTFEKSYSKEEILILDFIGAPVWSGQISGAYFSINIDFLPKGAYFLKIGNEIKVIFKD